MRFVFRLLSRFLAIFAALGLVAQPVAAQSILRDAETEVLLQEMVDPLAKAAGLQEGAVEIVLVGDPSINAFVAGGQRIYIHSGLINAADTANEVQGVMAHELGHITGGHIIRHSEGASNAMKITLLSALLGAAAALAGGGEAAMGALALGQQAAMGSYLAFTRTQEASADAAGAEFLSKAGLTGKGSISFFQKLEALERRYGRDQSDDATFARTHPLSGDRIARLQLDYEADPAWDVPPDPGQQARFEILKAKLYGYLAKPDQTLDRYPLDDDSTAAHYARAYAYHKDARTDLALAATETLIARDPQNPYYLELKGQVLLESGRPGEALPALRKACELSGYSPLIASTFGHALIATEDRSQLTEAERVLKAAVGKDRQNPWAWYQLGVVYGTLGDIPRARLASAEQQVLNGEFGAALQNASVAERALPEGTPDWLRAQDVAMQAKAELERNQKRR